MTEHISGADLLRYLEEGEPEREQVSFDHSPLRGAVYCMRDAAVPVGREPSVALHLAGCAECREKADRLRQAMGVVEAFACPPREEVVNYALDELPVERLPSVRAHLGHCRSCNRLADDAKAMIVAESSKVPLAAEYARIAQDFPAKLAEQLSPELSLSYLFKQMRGLEDRIEQWGIRRRRAEAAAERRLLVEHIDLDLAEQVLSDQPQDTPIMRPMRRAFKERGLIWRRGGAMPAKTPSPFPSESIIGHLERLTADLMELLGVSSFPRFSRTTFARTVSDRGWKKRDADQARDLVEQLRQLWSSLSHLAPRSAERRLAQRRAEQLARIVETIADLQL